MGQLKHEITFLLGSDGITFLMLSFATIIVVGGNFWHMRFKLRYWLVLGIFIGLSFLIISTFKPEFPIFMITIAPIYIFEAMLLVTVLFKLDDDESDEIYDRFARGGSSVASDSKLRKLGRGLGHGMTYDSLGRTTSKTLPT